MKRAAILLALLCILTVSASAAYIPENVVSENRDGRQLIVKTYSLPPDADPSELVEEPFEVEGYRKRPDLDRNDDQCGSRHFRSDPLGGLSNPGNHCSSRLADQ